MSAETRTFQGFDEPQQNWAKLPFALIDALPLMQSESEVKVVLYILRHTWGYSEFDAPKKITVDEFCNGRKRKDESRIDGGTGLSEPAIRSGIEKAILHGFIECEVDDSDLGRIKKYYRLCMSGAKSLPPVSDDKPEVKDISPRGKEVLPRTEIDNSPYIEKSTSLSTASQVERVSDSDSDAKEIDLFATIPTTEPMRNTHKPTKVIATATEPNLTPYKVIVSPLLPEMGEEVVEEKPAKKVKVRKTRAPDLELKAVIKAFGLIPTAYAKNALYKSLIFGSTKPQKGVWADAQLDPPATIDELERYIEFAEDKADEFDCCTPTQPATIQAWFEEFRAEERRDAKQEAFAKLLRIPEEIIPIGIQRERERLAAQAAAS